MLPTRAAICSLPPLLPQGDYSPICSPDLGADGHSVSPADTSPETVNDAGTRMDTGFRHDSAQLGTMSHETGDGARCRVRTGRTPAEHQALAQAYSPHYSPGTERALGPELSEVIAAWPLLAGPLKAAVLAIVRSVGTDSGGLVKRGLRVVGEEGK